MLTIGGQGFPPLLRRGDRAARVGVEVKPRYVLIAVGALVVVLAAMATSRFFSSGDHARAGSAVAGIDISGMTRDEAAAAVESGLAGAAAKRIRIRLPEQIASIKPVDAGLSIDGSASVAPAFGRTLNPLVLLGAGLGSSDLTPVMKVDQAALDAQVASVAASVDTPPGEPSITIRDTKVSFTPGKPGTVMDQKATAAAVVNALLKPRTPVDAVFTAGEPLISNESARATVKAARAAISTPISINVTRSSGAAVTVTLPPKAIANALSYTISDGAFEPQVDGAALHAALAKQLKDVETPGNDATFQIVNDVPQVVPSTTGNGVADADLAEAVLTVVKNPQASRTVSVSLGTRPPMVTTEDAAALGITEKLSTFTQRFPYAPYRVQNIGEAARRVNGTLLLPGATFSMNDTIGERTVKNGYTTGYVVGPGGIFTEDLGGGVSTATTATWTAAFFAGLERVSTTAHSIYISRYRAGLEATVAWGNFDMKFKNDTPNGVFITATTTRTSVTVTMWGTKQFDEVKAVSHPREAIKPYVTLIDTSPTCHAQGGEPGFAITVDRVFIKGGEEVKREPITTYYKPGPEVKCHKLSKAELAAAAANGETVIGPSAAPTGPPGSAQSGSGPSGSGPSGSGPPSALPSVTPSRR